MGSVFWHVTMSLDGFIAGPHDSMDWVFGYFPLDFSANRSIIEEIVRSTGSVLSGRRSYDVGRKPGQGPEARKELGGAWSDPVFVVTHQAPEDEADPSIKFLSGNIRSAVGGACAAAGGQNVMVIGAGTSGQCIKEALVDEITVYLAPLLLGDGVRFLPGRGRRMPFDWRRLTSRGQDSSRTSSSVSSNRLGAATINRVVIPLILGIDIAATDRGA